MPVPCIEYQACDVRSHYVGVRELNRVTQTHITISPSSGSLPINLFSKHTYAWHRADYDNSRQF